MILVLTAASIVLVAGGLAVASAGRWLARQDHRCTVRTRAGACPQCDAVVAGRGQGGHMSCACGTASPHLAGMQLLAWRAEHVGERLPHQPVLGPAASHLGEAAEAARSMELLEEQAEVERRAIVKARRNPDPITPQLLREAGVEAGTPTGGDASTTAFADERADGSLG